MSLRAHTIFMKILLYLVEQFPHHVQSVRLMYPVLFSTVQQVVLFDLFQNKFLHVYHFHVQRFRSPIYTLKKNMA